MYTAVIVFIVLICILLSLVVLVQNSKGGGLAAGFSSSSQVMGVRRTTDVLEKLTWGFAGALIVFSIIGTAILLSNPETVGSSAVQEQIDNAAIPTPGMQVPPTGVEQPQQQQPVQ